jgi:thymidylate synthase
VALGLPFNIASYGLLTHVFARLTGYTATSLTVVTGDTHIYTNHVDGLTRQLARVPRGIPLLVWNRDFDSVDDLAVDTIGVDGYYPHPRIPMEMAV